MINGYFKFLHETPLHADESLMSWAFRVANAEGYSLRQLLALVGGVNFVDLDVHLTRELSDAFESAAWWMSAGELARANSMLLGAPAEKLDAMFRTGSSRNYVVCPRCLAEGIPYFRTHWRMGAVNVCEVHRCLLIDTCDTCGATTSLNAKFQSKIGRRLDILGRCLNCYSDLANENAIPLGDRDYLTLFHFQQHWRRKLRRRHNEIYFSNVPIGFLTDFERGKKPLPDGISNVNKLYRATPPALNAAKNAAMLVRRKVCAEIRERSRAVCAH